MLPLRTLRGITMPQHRVKAKAVIKKKQTKSNPKPNTSVGLLITADGSYQLVGIPNDDKAESLGNFIFGEGNYAKENPVSGQQNYIESVDIQGHTIFMDECGKLNHTEPNKRFPRWYGNLLICGITRGGRVTNIKFKIGHYCELENLMDQVEPVVNQKIKELEENDKWTAKFLAYVKREGISEERANSLHAFIEAVDESERKLEALKQKKS